MTIQNALEARALTERNRWDIEKLLDAVEASALAGDCTVIVQGRLTEELRNQLTLRGFSLSLDQHDTTIKW